MALFRVTVDSILMREADEDGDNGVAEWTVFFNSPRSAQELSPPGDALLNRSVRDGDVIQVDRSYMVDTGATNRLSLKAGGFENDGSPDNIRAEFLPSIQVDIDPVPVARGGMPPTSSPGFPFTGGDFAYKLTMAVAGSFRERPGLVAEVSRSDAAYAVDWRVASTALAAGPVGVAVDTLRVVEAREDPDVQSRRAEWNVNFLAGTVGSTESLTFPEQSVVDNQSVPVGRSFSVDPGGNRVLVLRTAGFEDDRVVFAPPFSGPNPDDPLPQGEVAIRPSSASSYGITTAVDTGEFAYEVNWTVSLLGAGVIIP